VRGRDREIAFLSLHVMHMEYGARLRREPSAR
jgi:hypothetical protein